MNDDLKKLGQMTPPAPSPAARARALSLAMQAFDQAENNSEAPKEPPVPGVEAPYSTGYGAPS